MRKAPAPQLVEADFNRDGIARPGRLGPVAQGRQDGDEVAVSKPYAADAERKQSGHDAFKGDRLIADGEDVRLRPPP